MSVVIPELDIEDFLENIKFLTVNEAFLNSNMKLSEVFERVNRRLQGLDEDIKLAQKWYGEYQKGIRSGAAKLEEEMKKKK